MFLPKSLHGYPKTVFSTCFFLGCKTRRRRRRHSWLAITFKCWNILAYLWTQCRSWRSLSSITFTASASRTDHLPNTHPIFCLQAPKNTLVTEINLERWKLFPLVFDATLGVGKWSLLGEISLCWRGRQSSLFFLLFLAGKGSRSFYLYYDHSHDVFSCILHTKHTIENVDVDRLKLMIHVVAFSSDQSPVRLRCRETKKKEKSLMVFYAPSIW